MDNILKPETGRLFLIETLPEPLTPASPHIQIFDNYVADTRVRLRKIRNPYTKAWTYLVQKKPVGSSRIEEINLDAPEYAALFHLEGREIRKNRYFHEFEGCTFTFDVYLGRLWGLATAMADLPSGAAVPPFAILELTNSPIFDAWTLVEKTTADLQAAISARPPA